MSGEDKTLVRRQFQSKENIEYFKNLLARRFKDPIILHFLNSNIERWIYDFDVNSVFESDELAVRGISSSESTFWDEIKRANILLYHRVLEFVKDYYSDLKGDTGMADDKEDLSQRMFWVDQVRPPGYESLNGAGNNLYSDAEDRNSSSYKIIKKSGSRDIYEPIWVDAIDGFDRSSQYNSYKRADKEKSIERNLSCIKSIPTKSSARALLDYYDDRSKTKTTLATSEYGSEKTHQDERISQRVQRYKSIPFWQNLNSRQYEKNISDTLGQSKKESEIDIRKYDMSRLIKLKGMQ